VARVRPRTVDQYALRNGRIVGQTVGSAGVSEFWLTKYTDDFDVIEQKRVLVRDQALPVAERERFLPDGIGDFRVFKSNNSYSLLGNGANLKEHLNTMILGHLSNSEFILEFIIKSPRNQAVEKNWMPIDAHQQPSAIYSVNPLCLINIKEGEAWEEYSRPYDPKIPAYRGSSQVIRYCDGMLCIVHRVISVKWRRIYLHRFIFYRQDWQINAMSPEFFIEKRGLEFCAGLARRGDRYAISYGVDDIMARAVVLSGLMIKDLLIPWTQRRVEA
jgi:hypothetical protein